MIALCQVRGEPGGSIAIGCGDGDFAIGVTGPYDGNCVGGIFIIGHKAHEFDRLVTIVKGGVAEHQFGECDEHIGGASGVVGADLNLECVGCEVASRIGDGQCDGVNAFGQVSGGPSAAGAVGWGHAERFIGVGCPLDGEHIGFVFIIRDHAHKFDGFIAPKERRFFVGGRVEAGGCDFSVGVCIVCDV